jgi:hypothetical protein
MHVAVIAAVTRLPTTARQHKHRAEQHPQQRAEQNIATSQRTKYLLSTSGLVMPLAAPQAAPPQQTPATISTAYLCCNHPWLH